MAKQLESIGGGAGRKLLWKNSNTGASFGPQKIGMDLSEYDVLLVTIRGVTNRSVHGTGVLVRSDIQQTITVQDHTVGMYVFCRAFTFNADDGLTVGGGAYLSAEGQWSARNDAGVPAEIYGIRL